MTTLQRLDAELSKLRGSFKDLASGLELSRVCSLANEKRIAKQNYRGIYLIEIRTTGPHRDLASWVSAFKEEWEHPNFKAMFTPNTKKKRISFHKALSDWMPLYIGKSKNVAGRVWEHINLDLRARTFALKLRARPNMKLHQLRLSTINLDALGIQNYDLLAPALEHSLREKLHPIVGKQ